MRLTKTSAQGLTRGEDVFTLGATLAAVFGIASYEASLQVSLSHPDSIYFILSYAYHNLLPSVVWATVPAVDLVSAYGFSSDLLITPSPMSALAVQSLGYKRAVIAGFMTTFQILRMVNIGLQARDRTLSRIRRGKEPMLHNSPHGRVIRLCGTQSDVTRLSLHRYGEHILPIFENHRIRFVRHLTRSRHLWEPVWWCVRPEEYGEKQRWAQLGVCQEWCINTLDNKRVLVAEADSLNIDGALMFGQPCLDLTEDKACQAFRNIEAVVQDYNSLCKGHIDSVLRVYLADSLKIVCTGGGNKTTLRKYMERTSDMDVFIDASAPLLQEVLKYCYEATTRSSTSQKKLIFHSNSTKYFSAFKELYGSYGYDLVDRDDPEAEGLECRIVHGANTFDTVNSVYALLRHDPSRKESICALVDRYEGVEEIKRISALYDKQVTTICAAEVHDDLLREVRISTRMGYSPSHIQSILDRRFRPILFHAQTQANKEDVES